MLDFCDFTWFRLFGIFLSFVIWSSLLVTLTGISSVLCELGPVSAEDGEIYLPASIKKYMDKHESPAEEPFATELTES